MIRWLKRRLDRLTVALVILACLAGMTWRTIPNTEEAAAAVGVRAATDAVDSALDGDRAVVKPIPDYRGAFLANMRRTEEPMRSDLAAWRFAPRPPMVVPEKPPPDKETLAVLTRPLIGRGGVWVGKATVKVSFGSGDRNCRGRALQVWRKAPADAGWPREPLVTIRVPGEGAAELPPGVTATSGGYELAITDQAARVPWEYRVRAAAVFPDKILVAVAGGDPQDCIVKLPPEAAEREDLLADELAGNELTELLAGRNPAFRLLPPGAFVSRFSETVTVELPGESQIAYEAPVSLDGTDFANFRIRRYLPEAVGTDRDGWLDKLERFAPGDDIRLPASRYFVKDPVSGRNRPGPADLDSGFRLVRLQDKTAAAPGASKTERVAVVLDKVARKEIELVARADGGGWWPKNPPLTPKPEEPKPAMAANPAVLPAPAPAPPAPR
jgi:hypothetical protein